MRSDSSAEAPRKNDLGERWGRAGANDVKNRVEPLQRQKETGQGGPGRSYVGFGASWHLALHRVHFHTLPSTVLPSCRHG